MTGLLTVLTFLYSVLLNEYSVLLDDGTKTENVCRVRTVNDINKLMWHTHDIISYNIVDFERNRGSYSNYEQKGTLEMNLAEAWFLLNILYKPTVSDYAAFKHHQRKFCGLTTTRDILETLFFQMTNSKLWNSTLLHLVLSRHVIYDRLSKMMHWRCICKVQRKCSWRGCTSVIL